MRECEEAEYSTGIDAEISEILHLLGVHYATSNLFLGIYNFAGLRPSTIYTGALHKLLQPLLVKAFKPGKG